MPKTTSTSGDAAKSPSQDHNAADPGGHRRTGRTLSGTPLGGKSLGGKSGAESREERLAEALRENLRKRKQGGKAER